MVYNGFGTGAEFIVEREMKRLSNEELRVKLRHHKFIVEACVAEFDRRRLAGTWPTKTKKRRTNAG